MNEIQFQLSRQAIFCRLPVSLLRRLLSGIQFGQGIQFFSSRRDRFGQHRNIGGLKENSPEPFGEMHPETGRRFGIKGGDWIRVESNRGEVRVRAHVTDAVMEGVVSIAHGWPGEANVNRLTDLHCREPIMGYPQMKSQLCSIRKD